MEGLQLLKMTLVFTEISRKTDVQVNFVQNERAVAMCVAMWLVGQRGRWMNGWIHAWVDGLITLLSEQYKVTYCREGKDCNRSPTPSVDFLLLPDLCPSKRRNRPAWPPKPPMEGGGGILLSQTTLKGSQV